MTDLDREAFETWYAADMVAFGFSKTTAAEIAGLRDGDGYGDRPALNFKWEGWQGCSSATARKRDVLREGWARAMFDANHTVSGRKWEDADETERNPYRVAVSRQSRAALTQEPLSGDTSKKEG